MSKGKWEKKEKFDVSRYTDIRDKLDLTDREVCKRIKGLHIVISKDPLYPDNPDKDNIVTCTPQNLTKAKGEGFISPSILKAIGKVLGVAPEYLSGDITDADLDFFFVDTPTYEFHELQEFYNLSPEKKEEYFKFELFDLGFYSEWLRMNTRQRSNCHIALREFITWMIYYGEVSGIEYSELFDFFEKTGVLMEPCPDLRKELINTLKITYKTFMEIHK